MKTCLIVDDSRLIRKFSRQSMESLGFAVSEATNGQEAIDSCESTMPDIILLDWNMPVMSGIEFLRLLRTSNYATQPKVVFCTTESDAAHIEEAIAAGADEYVMKPFDHDTLHMKLQIVGVA